MWTIDNNIVYGCDIMINKLIYRVSLFIAFIFSLSYSITLFTHRKLDKIIACIFLIISTFVPFIISRLGFKKDIKLNPLFHFIFLVYIFLSSYLGTVLDFYKKFPWWDKMLHLAGGIIFSLLGIYVINILIDKGVIGYINSNTIIPFIAFCFSSIVSSLWEIFEYLMDVFFHTNMTDRNLDDTMIDMIAFSIGGLIICTIYYFILRKSKRDKGHP